MKEWIIESATETNAISVVAKENHFNPIYLDAEKIEGDQFKVFLNRQVKEIVVDWLNDFFRAAGIENSIKVIEDEVSLSFIIDTPQNSLFIGKEGRVLNSIQLLTRQIVYTYDNTIKNVSVDIGGYKENRNHHLEMLATKTAKEVARTGIPASLDNLNSYERRIIHSVLSEWRDVITESVGEGHDRHLLIKPKK